MVARGSRASPSRTTTSSCVGTAMMRRGGRSITIGHGCSRELRGRRSSCELKLVERGFALILDRGGMRRVWLRGRENVQKRYLIHVAGYNLGLVMRLLTGAGTPREFQRQAFAWFFAILEPDGGLIAMILVFTDNQVVAGAVYIATVDSS